MIQLNHHAFKFGEGDFAVTVLIDLTDEDTETFVIVSAEDLFDFIKGYFAIAVLQLSKSLADLVEDAEGLTELLLRQRFLLVDVGHEELVILDVTVLVDIDFGHDRIHGGLSFWLLQSCPHVAFNQLRPFQNPVPVLIKVSEGRTKLILLILALEMAGYVGHHRLLKFCLSLIVRIRVKATLKLRRFRRLAHVLLVSFLIGCDVLVVIHGSVKASAALMRCAGSTVNILLISNFAPSDTGVHSGPAISH